MPSNGLGAQLQATASVARPKRQSANARPYQRPIGTRCDSSAAVMGWTPPQRARHLRANVASTAERPGEEASTCSRIRRSRSTYYWGREARA